MAYRLKTVRYKDIDRRILLQNENGPCPLLAAANALLLKGTITLPPHCLRNGMATLEDVTNLLANQAMASPTSTTRKTTIAGSVNDDDDPHCFHIDELLQHIPRFQYGMDVNPKFTSITAYEYTAQLTAFDLLGVKLVHGWLVDPHDDYDTASAIGTLSYNSLVELVIQGNEAATELERLQQQNQNVDPSKQQQLSQLATRAMVIDHFLQSTSHQLTQHGLQALYQDLRDDELTVFFRNNHFGTLTKHKGMLYLLVTDFGYADAPEIVWEKLDVINGDTEYVNATFQPSAAAAAAAQQAAMASASQQENADYQLAMQLSMQNQPNQTQQSSSSVPLPQQQQQSATAASSSSSQLPSHYLAQQQQIAVGVPLAAPPKAPPQSAPSAAASLPKSPPPPASSPGYVLNSTLQPIPPPPPRPKLPPQPESARLKPPPPGSLKEPPQSSTIAAAATVAVNKPSPTMVQLPPPRNVTTSTAAAANPVGYAMTSPSMTTPTTGQSSVSSPTSPTPPNSVSTNPNKPKTMEEADRLLAIQLQSFSDGGTGRGAGLANNSSAANNPYEDESLALARQLQDQEDEFARIRRLNQPRQQQQHPQQPPRTGGQTAAARPVAATTATGTGAGRGAAVSTRAGGDGSSGQGCQIS